MSKRFCGKCKSTNIVEDGYCGGWTYYRCETCGHVGDKKAFPLLTLFNHITQSPEVLAGKLVYCENEEHIFSCASWRSTLLGNTSYARKDEAIAATVAKLKEEYQ